MAQKDRFSQVANNVVILADAQNVSNIIDKQIYALMCLPYSSCLGHLIWKAVYIDLKKSHRNAKKFWKSFGFEIINIPGSREDKNRADRRLMEDCRKYIKNNPQTKVVILVSGDGDFVKFVEELKAKGIKVIVVSQQKSLSKKLKIIADQFFTLDQIEQNFIFSLAE